tara:strand:- start:3721 stop:4962 length:1242 start_codon:yes stop_codon:yes gene_type:complete
LKKILLITYYWKNSESVGKKRWVNFISELGKSNFDISVLTFGGRDFIKKENNYTLIERNINSANKFFSNKIVKNYSRGVIDSSSNIFLSILSWIRVNFFIPDGRILYFKKIENFAVKYITENSIDTLITTSPPHSIQKLGMRIKKRTGVNWISDFRDPYLNWNIMLSMKPIFISKMIHNFYQKKFIKASDKVIVTNSELRKEFLKISTIDKINLINNGSNIKPEKYNNNKFILSYFGLLNMFRNPEKLIDTLDIMLEEDSNFRSKFEFHLFGNIQKSTVNYISKKKNLYPLTRFDMINSEKELISKMSSSSILLLLLDNLPIQNTTPYKLYEYLVSEKLILTLGDYENIDVDRFLKDYKRNNRIRYDDVSKIRSFIKKSFMLYDSKKLKNININYSDLRYSSLIFKLIKVIKD